MLSSNIYFSNCRSAVSAWEVRISSPGVKKQYPS
jgi:hypothetical protein